MASFTLFIMLALLIGVVELQSSTIRSSEMIKIRGHYQVQQLPYALTKSWRSWTWDNGLLLNVPTSSLDDEDWVDPITYSNLFLPQDLPSPKCQPAIALGVTNGVARYIMPSIVLTLTTPSQVWRNRGLCSLPRAFAWIDMFSEYAPKLTNLRYSCFGLNGQNLRFLEDQDGSSAWVDLLSSYSGLLGEQESTALRVSSLVSTFQAFLTTPDASALAEGYHFVDIPLPGFEQIPLPQNELRAYLTELDEPKRLLELEDRNLLDTESCGEIAIKMQPVSAGGDSPYLPEVYKDLYEEGNILFF